MFAQVAQTLICQDLVSSIFLTSNGINGCMHKKPAFCAGEKAGLHSYIGTQNQCGHV